jgi:hypothetical protein
MNQDEYLDLLSRFSGRALPAQVGRHVYLWQGSTSSLLARVPGSVSRVLDLHQLAAGLARAPRSIDAARPLLNRAIRSQLDDLISPRGQQVIAVTGCDLLSRYRVRLALFFEKATEQVMIVFVVPANESHFQPSVPLPGYVALNPQAPLEYLSSVLDKRAVIAGAEELR